MGYRLLPHTADVMVSAWAESIEDCLREAVRGLVSCFADVGPLQPRGLVGFACDPAPDQELLVELLEEAVYLIDARDVVPVQVALARGADGGLVGEFGVVPCADVPLVGPVPKAVSRHGLCMEHHDSSWQCRVLIDV
jgi:protein archease